MKRKMLFFPLMLGATLLFFTNCKKSESKSDNSKLCENKECSCDSCICNPCECKSQPIGVKQAYLYLDNSESMKGYVNDIKGYTDVLTQLTHAYNNTKVLLCCDNYKSLDGDLVSEVKKLRYGGSSLLHYNLQEMLGKAKSDNIVFFVTDGIMSGKDTDIKGDREWTLSHASDLRLNVKKEFSKKGDVAVSIYQFTAQFNGKYFCYDNSNAIIQTSRYFYVFVIGSREVVKSFKETYVGSNYFKPTNQLHFIDNLPLSDGIHVKNSKHQADDVWEFNLEEINKKADNPKMMVVTVTSDQFKTELNDKQIAELAKYFNVKISGKTINEVIYDETNKKYVIMFSPALGGSKFSLDIAVPYDMPKWVAASSCSDDLYMIKKGQADNRTFLLEELIDGIRQGKLGEISNLYQATVNLKRKKQ